MEELLTKKYSDYSMDRKFTFLGVLRNYFDMYSAKGERIGISRRWNNETANTYIRDYNQRLLPLLDPWKALDEYTENDFNQVIEKIRKDKFYTEGTTAHYRHLIFVVCEIGYRYGHCTHIPWSEYIEEERADDEHAKGKIMTRMKKSFTPLQDVKIATRLFDNPCMADGEDVGLLLMYCCAFRNSEACGLNYGHLVEMNEHPGCYELILFQTAKDDRGKKGLGGEVKGGGKTRNANRILPVMDKLRDYLLERKKFLQQKIDDGTLKTRKGCVLDVDTFPIVCRGQEYTVRCQGRNLTQRGQKLFQEVGLKNDELRQVEKLLSQARKLATDIRDKDATTYLFRRHAGTMLHILGLSLPQIQYYMGQDVEDAMESRNGYTNEHKLIEIKEVLELHPINYLVEKELQPQIITSDQQVYFMPQSPIQHYQLPIEDGSVRITVSALEILDTVEVSVKTQSGESVGIEFGSHITRPNTERTVNVQKQMVDKYRAVYRNISKRDE